MEMADRSHKELKDHSTVQFVASAPRSTHPICIIELKHLLLPNRNKNIPFRIL